MPIPIEVNFRGLEPSEFVEARVNEYAGKLAKYFDHISFCRVMIELPHQRKNQGNLYHVRIEVGVPGDKLVVSKDPGDDLAHEDAYVTIRDAFNAMKRQLQDYTSKMRKSKLAQGNRVSIPVPPAEEE